MIMLYFSGTGNSKYIAERFAEKRGIRCYSIEETVDFKQLIMDTDTVGFCYPIYGSCVPRILREFVVGHQKELSKKSLIIFCTQMMFSGDGARAFTDLIPGSADRVLYAEHFNMPNNISNLWFLPITEGERRRKYHRAEKKIEHVCKNIEQGIVKKRGWGSFAHWIGKSQSAHWPRVEEKRKSSFQADEDCNSCGLCAKLCPMHNLEIEEKGIKQNDNCILCYRCVNSCPQKAATVLIHAKPKKQYKAIAIKSKINWE